MGGGSALPAGSQAEAPPPPWRPARTADSRGVFASLEGADFPARASGWHLYDMEKFRKIHGKFHINSGRTVC